MLANKTSLVLPSLLAERTGVAMQQQNDAASHIYAALVRTLMPETDSGSAPTRSTEVSVYLALGTVTQKIVFPDLPSASFPAPTSVVVLHMLVPRLQPTSSAALRGVSSSTAWNKDGFQAVLPWVEDIVPRCINCVVYDWASTDLSTHSMILSLLVLLFSPAAAQLTALSAATTTSNASSAVPPPPPPSTATNTLVDLRRRYAWLLFCHSARCLRMLSVVLAVLTPVSVIRPDAPNTAAGTTSSTSSALEDIFDTDAAAAIGMANLGAGPGTSSSSATTTAALSSSPASSSMPASPPKASASSASSSSSGSTTTSSASATFARTYSSDPSFVTAPPLPNSGIPTTGGSNYADSPQQQQQQQHFSDWRGVSPQYGRLGKVLISAYRSWCLSLRSSSSGSNAGGAGSRGGPGSSASGASGAGGAGAGHGSQMPSGGGDSEGGAEDAGNNFVGGQGGGTGTGTGGGAGAGRSGLPSWQNDPLVDDLFCVWISSIVDTFVVSLWTLLSGCGDEMRPALSLIAADMATLVSWLTAIQRFAPASCAIASALLLRVAVWAQASTSVAAANVVSVQEAMLFGVPDVVLAQQLHHYARSSPQKTTAARQAAAAATASGSDATAAGRGSSVDLVNVIVERPAMGLSRSLLMSQMHARSQTHHLAGSSSRRRAASPQGVDSASSPSGKPAVHPSASTGLIVPASPSAASPTKRTPSSVLGAALTTSFSSRSLPPLFQGNNESGLSPPTLSFNDTALAPSATAAAASIPSSSMRRTTPPVAALAAAANGTGSAASNLAKSVSSPTVAATVSLPIPITKAASSTSSLSAVSASTTTASVGATGSPLSLLKPLILATMKAYKERRDVAVGVAALFMVRDALHGAKLNFVSDHAFLVHQLGELGATVTADPTRVVPLITELCVNLATAPSSVLQLSSSPWTTAGPASHHAVAKGAAALTPTHASSSSSSSSSSAAAVSAATTAARVQMTLNQIAYEIELADKRDISLGLASTWAACRLRQIFPLLEVVLANIFVDESASSASTAGTTAGGNSNSALPASFDPLSTPSSLPYLEDRLFHLLLNLSPRVPLALAPLADLLRAMRNSPEKYVNYSEQVLESTLKWLLSGRLLIRDAEDMAATTTIMAAVAPAAHRPVERLLSTLLKVAPSLSGLQPSAIEATSNPSERRALYVASIALTADRWTPAVTLLLKAMCRLSEAVLAESVALVNATSDIVSLAYVCTDDATTETKEHTLLRVLLIWIEAALVAVANRQVPAAIFLPNSSDLGSVALPFHIVCLCELIQTAVFLIQGEKERVFLFFLKKEFLYLKIGPDAAVATPTYCLAAKSAPIAKDIDRICLLAAPLASLCPALVLRCQHFVAALRGPSDLPVWMPFVSLALPYSLLPSSTIAGLSRGAATPMTEVVGLCSLALNMYCGYTSASALSAASEQDFTLAGQVPVLSWLSTANPSALVELLLCLTDQPATQTLLQNLPEDAPFKQWLGQQLRVLWDKRTLPPVPPRRPQFDRRIMTLLMQLPGAASAINTAAQTAYPSLSRQFTFEARMWSPIDSASTAASMSLSKTQQQQQQQQQTADVSLPTSIDRKWWWRLLETHLLPRIAVPSMPTSYGELSCVEAIATAFDQGGAIVPVLEYLREQALAQQQTPHLRTWCALLASSMHRHIVLSGSSASASSSSSSNINDSAEIAQLESLLVDHTKQLLVDVAPKYFNAATATDVSPVFTLAHIAQTLLPLLQDQVEALRLAEAVGVTALLRFWSSWVNSTIRPPTLPHALRWILVTCGRLVTWWVDIATSPSRLSDSILMASEVMLAWDQCEESLFSLLHVCLPSIGQTESGLATSPSSFSAWDLTSRLMWLRRWLRTQGADGADALSPHDDANVLASVLCNLHANQLYLFELVQQELIEPQLSILTTPVVLLSHRDSLSRSGRSMSVARARSLSQANIAAPVASTASSSANSNTSAGRIEQVRASLQAALSAISQLDISQRQAHTKMDLMYLSSIFDLANKVGWTPGVQFTILQRLARSCLWVHVNDPSDSANLGAFGFGSGGGGLSNDRSSAEVFGQVVQVGVQVDDVLAELGALRSLSSILLMSLCGTPGDPGSPLLHFPREVRLPLLRSKAGNKLVRTRRRLDGRTQMLSLLDDRLPLLPDLIDGVGWDTTMSSSSSSGELPTRSGQTILMENVERPSGLGRSRLQVSQLPVASLLQGNPYTGAPPANVLSSSSMSGDLAAAVQQQQQQQQGNNWDTASQTSTEDGKRLRALTNVRTVAQPSTLFGLLKRQHAADQVSQLLRPSVALLQQYLQASEVVSVALPVEAAKELVLLSDLFRTTAEHERMVALMSQFLRSTHPDDSIALPWAALGLCKSLAALEGLTVASNAQIAEVTSALERLLAPQRGYCFAYTAAMSSVLYLIEGHAKAIVRPSLPLLLRFLLTHIQNAASSATIALNAQQLLASLTPSSASAVTAAASAAASGTTPSSSVPSLPTPTLALALSVSMCLIESFPAEVEQMDFARKTVAAAAALAFRRDCPEHVYLTVLRSLERLLLCGKNNIRICNLFIYLYCHCSVAAHVPAGLGAHAH